jgi:glycosyltransferase involved in cell wall biosynthesis
MNNSALKLRRLVPASIKRAAKEKLLERKLKRAVAQVRSLPLGEVPSAELLLELQAGWSNEGYAARTDYLAEVAKIAATTSLPILECGSGLTTILVGLLAGRRGVKTYSLEHTSEWRARIINTLRKLRISQVEVSSTPLRDFDGFSWYDAPMAELPKEFGLVICDGPPGSTLGGRYGLLPVMSERMPPGCVILLDDTERESEVEALRRWSAETQITILSQETPTGSYAVITREPAETPTKVSSGREGSSSRAVSVIIPAYNAAPYIGETLESVFAQTFSDYEVIVINDGSPDTEALERSLEPYRERIRYLNQENGGASAARNAGLRVALGEFIAFLDADDVWSVNYLAEQLKFIREQNCDLVCADALIAGDSLDAGKTYMEAFMKTAPASGRLTFLQLVNAEQSIITSGVIARRDLILEVGLFDLALRNAQDFDLWLRLVQHGARLAYQRKVLLEYRARKGSLSGDAINSHKRELRVFDKIERSYPLSENERREVMTVIQKRRALLEYELGKMYLLPGDFVRARESFTRANSFAKNWKARVALELTLLAPRLLQAIYLRRTGERPTRQKSTAIAGT